MRSLSSLLLTGLACAATVSAYTFTESHGRRSHLVARKASGVACKNGFVKTDSGNACYCPSDKFVSVTGTKCSAACSSGSYPLPGTQTCVACTDPTVLRCSFATVATACMDGYFLSGESCVETCPPTTWADLRPTKNKCRPCSDPDATSCTDAGHRAATGCLTRYLYKGECLDADDVPAPYYPDTDSHTAEACTSGVASCIDATTANSCGKLNGKQLFLTSNYTCVDDCPSGSYDNAKLKACVNCDSTMKTCDADGAITCAKDSAGTQLYLTPSKTCILPWTGAYAGYYEDDSSASFKACDDGVTSCIGSGDGNALTCGKKLDGTSMYFVPTSSSLFKRGATTYATSATATGPLGSCVVAESCPDATFADSCTASCAACDSGETECSGTGAGKAITCKDGLYLTVGKDCVTAAVCASSGAFFADGETSSCTMSGTGETSCTGNLPGSATGCGVVNDQQLYLYQGYCVASSACPGNYFADPVSKICSPCAAYTNSCTSLTNALSCGVNDKGKQLYLSTTTAAVLTASNTTLTNSTLTNLATSYCVTKDKCSANTYADPGTRTCESCQLLDEDALYCSSPFVITCATRYLQNGECVDWPSCVSGTYGQNSTHTCASCSNFGSDVATCDDSGALSCYSGLIEDHACVSSCSSGNYAQDGTCLPCSSIFPYTAECTVEGITKCDSSHVLQSGSCLSECDAGFFANDASTCVPCAGSTGPFPNSATCTSEKVLSCAQGFVQEGTASCATTCSPGESPSNGVCTSCGANQLSCDTSGALTCKPDYFLFTRVTYVSTNATSTNSTLQKRIFVLTNSINSTSSTNSTLSSTNATTIVLPTVVPTTLTSNSTSNSTLGSNSTTVLLPTIVYTNLTSNSTNSTLVRTNSTTVLLPTMVSTNLTSNSTLNSTLSANATSVLLPTINSINLTSNSTNSTLGYTSSTTVLLPTVISTNVTSNSTSNSTLGYTNTTIVLLPTVPSNFTAIYTVVCVASCPSGYYGNEDRICEHCPSSLGAVAACISANVATSCAGSYVLYDNKCVSRSCPEGYNAVSGKCVPSTNVDPCENTGDRVRKRCAA